MGRQQIVRRPEFEKDEEGVELPLEQPVGALPGNCRRVLSTPPAIVATGGGCRFDCPGRQRGGGCLLEVVRAAEAAGIKDWRFDTDPHDLFWDYAGPPIPGYTQVRGERPGEVFGTFDGVSYEAPPPAPPSFTCPHCAEVIVQDPDNFHFWCPSCGRNANDSETP